MCRRLERSRQKWPTVASEPPILETLALTVRYDGVVACDSVSLRVDAGSIVGLIGPNGAGKTSCIDAITGFASSEGDVRLCGTSIAKAPAHHRARLGLCRTWQGVELFAELTVLENLLVATRQLTLRSLLGDLVRPRRHQDSPSAEEALDLLGISDLADRYPSHLSLGQTKLVGVARAMASSPHAVLLDEPAAGLDTTESRDLAHRLSAVAAAGVGVLLVDHDMGLVLEVCDRIYVLELGRVIAEGSPVDIRRNRQVIEAYLGMTCEAPQVEVSS